MTLASYDDAISEATVNGKVEIYDFSKVAPVTVGTTGFFISLWYASGTPGAGSDGAAGSASANSGGTAHTSATGAINFADQSSDAKYIVGFEGQILQTTTQIGRLLLLDRLCSIGTLSLTATGTKNVNNVALPSRASDGVGVELWAEVSTATSGTAPVIEVNYHDTANASQTSQRLTFPAAATGQRQFMSIPWAAGGTGVLTAENVNVVTAASAGQMTLVLARTIGILTVTSGTWTSVDFAKQLPAMPRIYDGASLMLAYTSTSATAPSEIVGRVALIYG